LATAAIQGVMDEVTFPTMDGFVWDKIFYAVNATSISSRQIADGVMLVAITRGFLTTFMYLSVLLVFGAVPLSSVLPLIFSSMLAAWGWSAVMLAITARLENDEGWFALIGSTDVSVLWHFLPT
jgi:lipooligosaccharide transport system permease protein